MYVPSWVHVNCNPGCQDGDPNFFYSMELLKAVPRELQELAKPAYQRNSFWAHRENVILAMVSDQRKEVREKAVLYIQKARREFDPEGEVRKFEVQELNWAASFYFDMVNLNESPTTEPPLLMHLSDETIESAIDTPLVIPKYECHTQDVERAVALVTESAMQRVGQVNRHRWILNVLKSRKDRPNFNSKKDDLV